MVLVYDWYLLDNLKKDDLAGIALCSRLGAMTWPQTVPHSVAGGGGARACGVHERIVVGLCGMDDSVDTV